ncbi:hypothetical protein RB593_007947 [Gaeumannomyces tritici]
MAAKQLKPVAFVNAVMRSFWKESGLEPRLLGSNNFRIKDAQKGRVDFELDISEDHINRMKAIHGGTLASMVDLGGSLAVASMGLYSTGVSTDLNVTYLSSGGVVGDRLTGTATCDKKRLPTRRWFSKTPRENWPPEEATRNSLRRCGRLPGLYLRCPRASLVPRTLIELDGKRQAQWVYIDL